MQQAPKDPCRCIQVEKRNERRIHRGNNRAQGQKLGQNLGRIFGKLVRSAIWVRMHRFSAQTEPWRPKTGQIPFSENQTWAYLGHILPNLPETTALCVEMARLKRCALKNDAENRWNFVKWTNGDPKSTRTLGWIWTDFG